MMVSAPVAVGPLFSPQLATSQSTRPEKTVRLSVPMVRLLEGAHRVHPACLDPARSARKPDALVARAALCLAHARLKRLARRDGISAIQVCSAQKEPPFRLAGVVRYRTLRRFYCVGQVAFLERLLRRFALGSRGLRGVLFC